VTCDPVPSLAAAAAALVVVLQMFCEKKRKIIRTDVALITCKALDSRNLSETSAATCRIKLTQLPAVIMIYYLQTLGARS